MARQPADQLSTELKDAAPASAASAALASLVRLLARQAARELLAAQREKRE